MRDHQVHMLFIHNSTVHVPLIVIFTQQKINNALMLAVTTSSIKHAGQFIINSFVLTFTFVIKQPLCIIYSICCALAITYVIVIVKVVHFFLFSSCACLYHYT